MIFPVRDFEKYKTAQYPDGISQKWGENPGIYKRFGLKGHNGIDLPIPNNTEIIAPHSGKVIEVGFDKTGYGLYIKIENDKEGSVLAHLKENYVAIGATVSEGQLIASSDNTGFSTGAHLHWGYYKIPRNRQDGYLGYINQLPLLQTPPSQDPLQACLTAHKQAMDKVKELEDKVTDLEATEKRLQEEKDQIIIDRQKEMEELLADKKFERQEIIKETLEKVRQKIQEII